MHALKKLIYSKNKLNGVGGQIDPPPSSRNRVKVLVVARGGKGGSEGGGGSLGRIIRLME